jgi:putative ABC transport system permease protein
MEGVLTASLPLSPARFGEHPQKAAVAERIVERLRAIPGVEAAAVSLPLLGGWQSSFMIEGRPEPAPGQRPSADVTRVAGDYFRAMGMRVLEGRTFDERDRDKAPRVCMVDETFVKAHWPTESPLGQRVSFSSSRDPEMEWMEVVGVVAHVKNYGVDEDSRVEIYLPYLQASAGSGVIAILRTAGDPGSLTTALRQAIRELDPEIPVYQARPLPEIAADRNAPRRLAALLIAVFAAIALVLAAVGIYGVMAYAVAQRTQEIGLRMALGARREDILGMVLRSGTIMAFAGVGIGLVAALALARLITSLLFQTSATDPPTFSIVPLLLVTVALVACYIPARRATRVDPLVALRYE